ncbi:MAG: 3-hydroxyacyl-CoA dehydrogenase family protein [Geminicoccaceae bacterium]
MNGLDLVAVIGAGTMGHALALVHALGGCRVHITDRDRGILERSIGLIGAAADTLVQADAIGAKEAGEALARIEKKTALEETLSDAELVVEAIIESPAAKRSLFAEIDEFAPKAAVIASNTSYLDVFPLIPERRLEHSLIVHWYTPPYIVDLVDIAGGPGTDPGLLIRMRDFYQTLGKRPIVFEQLVQGYIANRLQSALNLEVLHLLDEGLATAEDIDTAIIHGLAQRLAIQGQIGKIDYTGLDMMQRAIANRVYDPPDVKDSSRSIDALIAEGRQGVMSGAGFYDYGDSTPEELFRTRDRKLLALKRALLDIELESGSDLQRARPDRS